MPHHVLRLGDTSVLQLEAEVHLQVCIGQLQTCKPPLMAVCTRRVMLNGFLIMQYEFGLLS